MQVVHARTQSDVPAWRQTERAGEQTARGGPGCAPLVFPPPYFSPWTLGKRGLEYRNLSLCPRSTYTKVGGCVCCLSALRVVDLGRASCAAAQTPSSHSLLFAVLKQVRDIPHCKNIPLVPRLTPPPAAPCGERSVASNF